MARPFPEGMKIWNGSELDPPKLHPTEITALRNREDSPKCFHAIVAREKLMKRIV